MSRFHYRNSPSLSGRTYFKNILANTFPSELWSENLYDYSSGRWLAAINFLEFIGVSKLMNHPKKLSAQLGNTVPSTLALP